MATNTCRLFLCGDVMTGRGIDQILRHPSRPQLYETGVRSALEYVRFAEQAHGPIPRGVDDSYVWGVALDELAQRAPAARIINLEASVTTSDDAVPKGINYRMHPSNAGLLTAAGIDCVVLANNHVLDWGERGLCETLDVLRAAHVATAGAGRTQSEAEAPAAIDLNDGHRVLVFAFAAEDSGVPEDWCATPNRPGVNWLGDYAAAATAHAVDLIQSHRRRGDIVIASVHWGPNWGYGIAAEHRRFAHRLVDEAAVNIVHGHSSHHVKAIEVYHDRLILYGCGDFLNDYEGIRGHAEFRDDLALMYFPVVETGSGALAQLELVPLRIRNFRLTRPSSEEASWLSDVMNRECLLFGGRVVVAGQSVQLQWPGARHVCR